MKKLDHIGIAVKDIDDAASFYSNLGLQKVHEERIPDQGVDVVAFQAGDTKIELLQAVNDASPVARFISKRGEGLHHIAIQVHDIEEVLDVLKKNGTKLIDTKPRIGAGNAKIAFIHPGSTAGVLIELSQPPVTKEEN